MGDLPGSSPGPFQDLRTTFGDLFATSLGSIKGFPGTVSGLVWDGLKTKKGSETGQIPSDRDENGADRILWSWGVRFRGPRGPEGPKKGPKGPKWVSGKIRKIMIF